MISTKPILEKISPNFGSSLFVGQHSQKKTQQASWHFHPELELVYVNKGKGKRHIGNHLSYFNNSQLILIGANLPHNGFADRLTDRGSETVVQFLPNFLGDNFFKIPETSAILNLFERAKKGIVFKPETKKKVGPKILELPGLTEFDRILRFLEILQDLALAKDYELLNVDGFAFETKPQDSQKIDLIFKHVNTNFKRHISLDEIADIVSMTVPSFCRYFKKSTGKTFTSLVNEYRVVHATKLLLEKQISITNISIECGFNNFSHFNKVFKDFTGKSASQYRNEMKKMIQ